MKEKILLIDDDPLVLKSFTKLLIHEGYEVIPVDYFKQALEAIRTREFNLIVSDIRMPEKDGVTLVGEIQDGLKAAGKKDLPIIFITGYAEDEIRLNAKFLGEVLHKPVDNDRLLTAIRDYL